MYPMQQGYYVPAAVSYTAPQGYLDNAQIAPQGLFGSMLGGLAGGLGGSALGGLIGGAQGRNWGNTIGSAIGGLAGTFLPFEADPGGVAVQPPPSRLNIILPPGATDPESQAHNAFLEDASRALIQSLEKYLSANAAQHPQLNDSIPLVQRAVELFEARDYARAFAQTFQAYRAIMMVRAKSVTLPSP